MCHLIIVLPTAVPVDLKTLGGNITGTGKVQKFLHLCPDGPGPRFITDLKLATYITIAAPFTER